MTAPTATQLRNARKRRAKKKNQVSTPSSNSPTSGNRTNSMAVPTSKRLHPSRQEKDDVTLTSSGKRRKRSDQFNSKSNAHSNGKQRNSCVDPSQKYSSHPLQAPIVQRAQQFFHDIFHTTQSSPYMMEAVTTTTGTGNDRHHGLSQYPTRNSSTLWNTTSTKFPVYVGSIYGWRTVVKLPVRYSEATTITSRSGSRGNISGGYHTTSNDGTVPPLITIGLFAPGSHQIVPIVVVENGARRTSCLCQTHHPVINQAIIHIQETARSLQPHLHHTTKSSSSSTACTHCLTAFSEETGKGYLRHIALSLQRHTNLVQLVLVWNSVPPSSSPSTDRCMGKNDVVDGDVVDSSETVLAQFLEALLQLKSAHDTADNDVNLEWHSIWVHYNNSWKHANAIFTHDGVWKLLYHHGNPSQSTLEADSTIHDKYSHKCPMNGITEYLTTMVEDDIGDVDHSKTTCTDTLVVVNAKSTIHQLPHVPLHFPPQVFRQGNITAFTNIVQSIRNFIIHQVYGSPNSNDVTRIQHRPSCLELYGGVGTIGLHMVDLCSKFVCSDENPYNVQCFNATVGTVIAAMKEKSGYYPMYDGANKNVEDNLSIPSIRYESASASVMVLDRMEHLNDVDIIIVDPPRKGMDADVCHALTTVLPLPTKTTKNNNSKSKTQAGTNVDDQPLMNEPQQVLIYVSCGFDAFVRDYQVLTQVSTTPTSNSQSKTKLQKTTPSNSSCNTNPWNLRHAEGHVLFPGSDAIETLAIFTRAKYLPKK